MSSGNKNHSSNDCLPRIVMPPNHEASEEAESGSVNRTKEEAAGAVLVNANHYHSPTNNGTTGGNGHSTNDASSSCYVQMTERSSDPFHPMTMTAAPTVSEAKARQDRDQGDAINRRWTIFCCVVAVLSLLTALVAMVAAQAGVMVCIAFVFPMVTAPFVIGQRRQLNKLPSYKEELNRIRKRVNRLRFRNSRLAQQNDTLDMEMKDLKMAEQQFEGIVRQQGASANQVKQLVKENAEIQRQMTQLQEAQRMQDLMKSLLKSDRDEDMKLSESEMEEFIVRFRQFSPRKLDEHKLRKAFANAKSTSIVNGIYSVGSDIHDDTSEYETFSFPRAYSQAQGTRSVVVGGMRMNMNNPGII